MTDEGAKVLAAAIEKLAAALQHATGNSLGGGFRVYHYGSQLMQQVQPGPSYWQNTRGGNTCGPNGSNS